MTSTDTPRVMSSVGDPTSYAAVTAALTAATDDGVTVWPSGRRYAGQGIPVVTAGNGCPVSPHALIVAARAGLTLADVVTAYVRTHAHTVTDPRASRPMAYSAGMDEGTLYLDVVEIWSDDDVRSVVRDPWNTYARGAF